MKKLLLLIVFQITFHSFAQLTFTGDSKYVLTVKGTMSKCTDCCGDKFGLTKVEVIRANGASQILFEGRKFAGPFSYKCEFTKVNPVIKVVLLQIVTWETGFNTCYGGPKEKYTVQNITTSCYSNYTEDAFDGLTDLYVWVSPKVNINSNSEVPTLGSDESLNILIPDNIDYQYFNWQYQVGAAPPKYLPAPYSGWYLSNNLMIKPEVFLTPNDYGKIVTLWNNNKCLADFPPERNSNSVTFTYRKSSPKIISHGPAVNTSCYDSNDGQYSLQFNRPLDSDYSEYIEIAVLDSVSKMAVNVNFKNITQLAADNSFTLTGLPPGTHELKVTGQHNGINTYSPTTEKPITISIGRNSPVDFSVAKKDIGCNNGKDGEITLTASGGTLGKYEYQIDGGNWVPFTDVSSATHTIKDLPAGDYTLKIRDGNQCIGKNQGTDKDGNIDLGDEKELKVSLSQPQKPLSIDYTLVQEPIYYGATNGKLVAKIEGGTIFDNNTYWFEWTNAQGQKIDAASQFTSGSFFVTLDNLSSGTYFLKVKDRNFATAIDNANCAITESEIKLTQPDPLIAEIELVHPVSCSSENEFGNETDKNPLDGQRDESQDGVLKINVNGGRPFAETQNNGRPYKYNWKKKNTSGNWETLPHNEAVIAELSAGDYSVNIEDANGIVIGAYANNMLVKPTDLVYKLQKPEKLVLKLETFSGNCADDPGIAKAVVSGGTQPYSYSWSDGQDTGTIEAPADIPLFLLVNDANGCISQGTVTVPKTWVPEITAKVTPLLCHDAADAEIQIEIEGGNQRHDFLWNTGATTSAITKLTAGTYTVVITNHWDCVFEKTVVIDNPGESVIQLGPDRTLCNGQSLTLDATVLGQPGTTYDWKSDNGFSSTEPIITISEAGTYSVKIRTENGCTINDEISVFRSNLAIDSEFFVTSQAYVNEEVVLVNVSTPKGQTTEWIFTDPNISVVENTSDYLTLRFEKEGVYTIALKQTQGDCIMLSEKTIIVQSNDGQHTTQNVNDAFVTLFTLSPNPNNGSFNVVVQLEKESTAKLRLFTVAGQLAMPDKKLPPSKIHNENFNLQLSPGTYILMLETPYHTATKKLIVY